MTNSSPPLRSAVEKILDGGHHPHLWLRLCGIRKTSSRCRSQRSKALPSSHNAGVYDSASRAGSSSAVKKLSPPPLAKTNLSRQLVPHRDWQWTLRRHAERGAARWRLPAFPPSTRPRITARLSTEGKEPSNSTVRMFVMERPSASFRFHHEPGKATVGGGN